jgi:hypothetical protein
MIANGKRYGKGLLVSPFSLINDGQNEAVIYYNKFGRSTMKEFMDRCNNKGGI